MCLFTDTMHNKRAASQATGMYGRECILLVARPPAVVYWFGKKP